MNPEFRNTEELSAAEKALAAFSPDTLLEGISLLMPSGPSAERCVGPYRLLHQIGRGGMGEVWRAEDTRLGRKVALKLLPAELARSPRSNARFLQEARAASSLDHPNICSIYEVGETADHQLYLVMPCYKGEPLQERIARGPLPVAEALDIAEQIARGLGEAHRNGIIHRDVKPANLMVTEDGTVKILDFGIAKLAGQDGLTRAGTVVGTLAYMSPEQLRGEPAGERADLWSLGVVLYEMLAGRHPFRGDPAVVLRESILHAEPEPLSKVRPDIPVELAGVIRSLLSKDPAARLPSAESVVAVLRKLAAGAPRSRPGWLGRVAAARWQLGGLGLIAFGLVVAGLFALSHSGNVPRAPAVVPRVPISAKPSPASDPRKSVAVLGFQNLSGVPADQWLGPAFTEMLTAELAAGGKVRVVSSEMTARARQDLHPREKDGPDRGYMGSLHALVRADLAVKGSYLPIGDRGHRRIRLDIQILNLPLGDTMASMAEEGEEAELFDLVTRAGAKLRSALGFSRPTPEQRLQARGLLPSGSETLRLYTEALSRRRSFDLAGARDLLLRARTLEPSSVAIQSALSETWVMLGQDTQAREAALRAFEGRRSLPQEMQLVIEARFYEIGKQWDRASDIYRALQTLLPEELEYSLKLADTLSMAGRGPEALAVLDASHERPAPDGNDPLIDLTEAVVAWRVSDLPRMNKAAETAIAKGRHLGSGLIVARGLIYQADLMGNSGRPREGIELLRQAQDLALRAGDRLTAARADAILGVILPQQGDFDGAEQAQQRALDNAREIGTAVGMAEQLFLLGWIHLERGELQEARSQLEDSLVWYRRIDYRASKAKAEAELAAVLLMLGDSAGTQRLLTESLALGRSTRRAEVEVVALQGLVKLKALEGDLEEALRLQESALAILLRLHRPRLAAEALESSANLLACTGDVAWARRRLTQAEAAGRRASNRLVSSHLLGTRAKFAFREGDLAASRLASEQQLHSSRQMRAWPLEIIALRGLARVAKAGGEMPQTRTFLTEAEGLAEKSGDQLAKMEITLELARLDLEQGALGSSLKLAREASGWHHDRHFARDESAALALAAEALLRLGRPAAAREAAARAQALIPESDHELRLEIAPALARVAATSDPDGALRTLGAASQEAGQVGFVPTAFEARLARGEILLRRGETATGRAELERLRKEAEAKGFLQISHRAAVVTKAQPRPAISP